MDIDKLSQRQAVLAWRDELILGIWGIVNQAGADAKRGVEDELAQAGLVDTIWDPANFTRDRVDGAMREAVLGDLKDLLTNAATDLQAIDEGYSPLADALLESLTALQLPSLDAPRDPAKVEEAHSPAPSGRLASAMDAISRQEFVKSAREWGSWALDIVGEASDAASQKLQSSTGLHDRIRRSAQDRIDTAWMGSVGDPPPLMGQLISAVETVGSEARNMAR